MQWEIIQHRTKLTCGSQLLDSHIDQLIEINKLEAIEKIAGSLEYLSVTVAEIHIALQTLASR